MKEHPCGFAEPLCPGGHPPRYLSAQLRRTDNLIFRKMNEIARDKGVEDVTYMHGWILHYLYIQQGQAVYQRDVERNFSITRSTTTNILQLMEKKRYIRREPVPEDARLKRLVLTEQGRQAHDKIHDVLEELNRQVDATLTEAERAELLRLLGKLQAGLGPCRPAAARQGEP